MAYAFSNFTEHASAGSAGTSFPCVDLYVTPNVPPKSFAGRNRYVYSRADGSRISKNTSPAMMSCLEWPMLLAPPPPPLVPVPPLPLILLYRALKPAAPCHAPNPSEYEEMLLRVEPPTCSRW
uniref:Uncharacterized protein n=1 Tax=Anopheles farauti TaxID=69004 RepID=A0A182QMD9_9DIPT